SPSPNKDHSKSSKAKQHKEFDQSLDASDSESSSCSKTFKPYDNYVPITERVLARNLKGFSNVLYAQVTEDNWKKHKEATASYVDLRMEIEGFHDFKAQNDEGINKVLAILKEVQDAIKEDPALNKTVLDAAEAYTKNSSNLTELLTLVKDLDFPGFKTTVESFQAAVIAQNDHLAKWVESSTSMA
ncbi:hypothetical protein Tco_1240568, partial [Tanacetum coccineum]